MENPKRGPISRTALEIGRRARRLRKAKGLTLEQAAFTARLGMGALSEIENGIREARIGSLKKLANALGCTYLDFLVDKPDAR